MTQKTDDQKLTEVGCDWSYMNILEKKSVSAGQVIIPKALKENEFDGPSK